MKVPKPLIAVLLLALLSMVVAACATGESNNTYPVPDLTTTAEPTGIVEQAGVPLPPDKLEYTTLNVSGENPAYVTMVPTSLHNWEGISAAWEEVGWGFNDEPGEYNTITVECVFHPLFGTVTNLIAACAGQFTFPTNDPETRSFMVFQVMEDGSLYLLYSSDN